MQIGGGFRIPAIIESSGARLVEVGTTNITTRDDYAEALERCIAPGAGPVALLRVHRSNFVLEGHVGEPSLAVLGKLAEERRVPLVVDQGSGACDALVRLLRRTHGERLPESTVEECLAAGATVVTFSGDKLLGGPQSGFFVGAPPMIARARKDPLARAFRLDKVRVAALEHVVGAWLREEPDLPWLRRLIEPSSSLRARAEDIALALAARTVRVTVEASRAPLGGGATPQWELPSVAVVLSGTNDESIYRRLLAARPAVVPRRENGRLVFDLRSVAPEEDAFVVEAIASACERTSV